MPLQTVLEQGGQFAGINRKVQLKALRWRTPDGGASSGDNKAGGGSDGKPGGGNGGGDSKPGGDDGKSGSDGKSVGGGGDGKAGEPKPQVVEALLILKHGGVLTHAGRAQVRFCLVEHSRTTGGCPACSICGRPSCSICSSAATLAV